jgi:hypothetical protein
MLVQPLIIDYPDSPQSVPIPVQIAAFRLARDVKAVMDRAVGKSLNMNLANGIVPVVTSTIPMRPGIRDGQVRNSSQAWWAAYVLLRDLPQYDPENEIYIVWHNSRATDSTGIAQPAPPHAWDESADPNKGGISTNGIGQVLKYMSPREEGHDRDQVAYNVHELGHALGRYHSPNRANADPVGYAHRSLMAYGYTHFSRGRPRRGEYANPKLFLPDEIVTFRAHAAFSDIPDRYTISTPGMADDFIMTRLDDAEYMVGRIDAANPDGPSQARARATMGFMWSERLER